MGIAKMNETVADPCPKCGYESYQGGYCFNCGIYRPSKRTRTIDLEGLDAVEFMSKGFGTQITALEETEEGLDAFLAERELRWKHRNRKKNQKHKSVVYITEQNLSEAAILVQGVVQPYGSTPEGQLVRAFTLPWRTIVECLRKDWMQAFKIAPRRWEEMIAAAFYQEGYDEVILTPRSGDRGRDVIAIRKGVGCIKIIGSVKAYAPGNLVRPDDVRALAGVLHGDPSASKGIITTTSDFAPSIRTDPYLAPFVPYRLELMNGIKLREWLCGL